MADSRLNNPQLTQFLGVVKTVDCHAHSAGNCFQRSHEEGGDDSSEMRARSESAEQYRSQKDDTTPRARASNYSNREVRTLDARRNSTIYHYIKITENKR